MPRAQHGPGRRDDRGPPTFARARTSSGVIQRPMVLAALGRAAWRTPAKTRIPVARHTTRSRQPVYARGAALQLESHLESVHAGARFRRRLSADPAAD